MDLLVFFSYKILSKSKSEINYDGVFLTFFLKVVMLELHQLSFHALTPSSFHDNKELVTKVPTYIQIILHQTTQVFIQILVWLHTPMILALQRQKQKDLYEL